MLQFMSALEAVWCGVGEHFPNASPQAQLPQMNHMLQICSSQIAHVRIYSCCSKLLAPLGDIEPTIKFGLSVVGS